MPAEKIQIYRHTGSNAYILPYINTENQKYMHIYIQAITQIHTYRNTYIHTDRLTD